MAIAKFPSTISDDWSVTAWENVALTLARQAGIHVPPAELITVAGKTVLVVDRFDRAGTQRIRYVSAMTMLEATDGEQRSYLEIAEIIERHSPSVERDLHELWRRIAFSILISNTDDHLRNHGFLRFAAGGWALSPAFDLNPNPEPGNAELSTAIDFDNPAASLNTLMNVASYFRLTPSSARGILDQVHTAVLGWRELANKVGIRNSEITLMESAFKEISERFSPGL